MGGCQAVWLVHHMDPSEARRFAAAGAEIVVPPIIELARADAMLARNRQDRGVRRQALFHDRLLLFHRPAAAALAARDHLDTLRANAHITTYMSARISTFAHFWLVRVRHHDRPCQQIWTPYRNVVPRYAYFSSSHRAADSGGPEQGRHIPLSLATGSARSP